MPHYNKKPGGLPHHQMLAPNLLGRHRPTGEQISSTWYSYSHSRINQQSPLDRLNFAPQKKKKLSNKQRTEKDMQQSGPGALSTPGEG
jgi:hypothetical protein